MRAMVSSSEVTAQVRLPVFGPFGPGEAMTVSAHAYAEDQ